ncbi:MAG: CBS domain-containing protein [Candidatus Kapabacteria bacterium]|nr:CBS domain-containing protein [Candidatus Kapabacteria bacterium]
MDIDSALLLLFLFLGIFISFLSALISNISLEKLNELSEIGYIEIDNLSKLKHNFDDKNSAFYILETVLYVISISIIDSKFLQFNGFFHLNIVYLILSFIFILILRAFFYALGIRLADSLAPFFLPLLAIVNLVNQPFISLIIWMNKTIGGKSISEASREEINALVESAMEDGSLDADEYKLLKNIMDFKEVYVTDVMTPRTVVFSLDADKTIGEVINLPEIKHFSRIPIWEGDSLDEGVIGYILTKDILYSALNNKMDKKLKDLVRKIYFIPDNVELNNALEQFLEKRQHLFIVVDEYGGVDGLITMEDVMETILGAEIVDEADRVVDLRKLAKQRRDSRVASITGEA